MLRITKTRFYSVPVVHRTLDILELLYRSGSPLKSGQVSEIAKISPTTTYRILRTLLQRGYVEQRLDGRFIPVKEIAPAPLRMRTAGDRGTVSSVALGDLSKEEIVQMLVALLETLSSRSDDQEPSD
jgi:hypothetical protein